MNLIQYNKIFFFFPKTNQLAGKLFICLCLVFTNNFKYTLIYYCGWGATNKS